MLHRVSLVVVVVMVLRWTGAAWAAGVEPLGRIEASGGAEKEDGARAGGRGSLELLGVLPIGDHFGIQSIGHYVGGSGSRFGLSAGPLIDWGAGKVGFFAAYQYRSHNDTNLVHLRPSASFYLPQGNINLFYSHPVYSSEREEFGVNHLQGTFSYFLAADWNSFLRKDNVEMTLGVQVNSFAGAHSGNVSNGVGPVFGFSFLPIKGLEVNLVKGTVDQHGRYRVGTGLAYNFTTIEATLKEIRRRYLEPNFFAPNGAATARCSGNRNPAGCNLGNLGSCGCPG
jgi:hypothetical protein